MKKTRIPSLAISAAMLLSASTFGHENIGGQKVQKPSNVNSIMAACNPASASKDLEVNNVRTKILNGGDMWWDLNNAKYEIPKDGKAHSLFSGALWIGGIDGGGQLKVAAMTYRQSGNDFWPGPLDTAAVSIDDAVCNEYNKIFKITRKEVEDFYGWYNCNSCYPGYTISSNVLEWPGNGDISKNQGKFLAPFYDADGDGNYDPYAGDYPDYNITGASGCNSRLFGDETLWWVFNDKGNIHTETGAQAIGLEIHAQAFGFSTNDEVNNMTFYNYKIINRSSFTVNQTYFGQWVDADLGYAFDDYVGCDVSRGLGYCYNGTSKDGSGGVGTYGNYPPAVGVDFFEGPFADANGTDDPITVMNAASANGIGYGNGVIDDERLGMARFVYYNNDFTVRGNPVTGSDFYGYLSGFWKDGLPFTYGSNAYNTGQPICAFMFPGDSDPLGFGTGGQITNGNWSEVTVNNAPADRRFMQSAGPFSLKPGAVNKITTGVVWAQSTQLGNLPAVSLMRLADDKAQALFKNCFNILNGPDGPQVTIQELDKELLLYLSYPTTSNNYLENYSEYDPLIIDTTSGSLDTTYNFEGYQIYQLRDGTVSATDLYNPDKARLVAQCDVKNGVKQLVNFEYSPNLNANIPQEMVNGADAGIAHSFKITEDQFATGNKTLVNHKTYYFMAVAYGYNSFKQYDPNDATKLDGQKKPFKAGRKTAGNSSYVVYSGIPHIVDPEAGGTHQHAAYGEGPHLTRIEGQGNGGLVLDLTQTTVDQILASSTGIVLNPTYAKSAGPVKVKVIDPLNIPSGTYEIKLKGPVTSIVSPPEKYLGGACTWTLSQVGGTLVVNSDKSIAIGNEQIIPSLGLSVTVEQTVNPLSANAVNGGILEATMTFADPTKLWLTAMPDVDGYNNANWIRSGNQEDKTSNPYLTAFNDAQVPNNPDPNQYYETVLGGTWAPYRLCAPPDPPNYFCNAGPAWNQFLTQPQFYDLASVDIVITSDKSKWSRCVVFETQDESTLAEGAAKKLDPRKSLSVDKEGRTVNTGGINDSLNPNAANYISSTGMGWFPGYAINIETGERLNICFGEDSWLTTENGRDMLWNPTSTTFYGSNFEARFGGKHYIYVFGHNSDQIISGNLARVPRYDACKYIRNKVLQSTTIKGTQVLKDAMWVNIPLLAQGHSLFETDVKVRLRISKPYRPGYSTTTCTDTSLTAVNKNLPMYSFNTADIETHKADGDIAKSALDIINVVPNPYYAYSAYESSAVDNRIKITNLPDICTVSIYTLSGTLIRQIKKDDPTKTSVDWDMRNKANIPIASGLYIIHVNVPGVGEKILKWFGVMRPVDLESF